MVSDGVQIQYGVKTKFGFVFFIWKPFQIYFTLLSFAVFGNRSVAIFYLVILEQTSATKLRRAAIERENGFCQAPMLTIQQLMDDTHHSTINGRAKLRENMSGAVNKHVTDA